MINYIRCRVAPRSTLRTNATLRRHPCEIIEWQGWESEEYRAKRVSLSTRSVTYSRIYRVLLKRLAKLWERVACSETKKESYQYTRADTCLSDTSRDNASLRSFDIHIIENEDTLLYNVFVGVYQNAYNHPDIYLRISIKDYFYFLFKKLIFLVYTNILVTPYITVMSNMYKGV